ncbi:MAG TPA: DUF1566 domain-containing protein [Myxococcota bacterium]|nr:DUF1566 domain-containing protein [Myxococcota bacterium]HRY92503.1 DUF1566 domain-containing protein [Myxococcota bacterium]
MRSGRVAVSGWWWFGIALATCGCQAFVPEVGGEGQPCAEGAAGGLCRDGLECHQGVCCTAYVERCLDGRPTQEDGCGHSLPGPACEGCAECQEDGQGVATCVPTNYDPASGCASCLAHFTLASGCSQCEPGWDPGQGCDHCLPHRDPLDDCASCLGHFSPESDCLACLGGWLPPDCAACADNFLLPDCEACAPGFEGEGCERIYCETHSCHQVPPSLQTRCYGADALMACPGTQGGADCAATPYCGQDGQVSEASHTFQPFTREDDPLIFDPATGLVWQVDFWRGPPAWAHVDVAEDYCAGLVYAGYADWRLPSYRELSTLLRFDRWRPALDTEAFARVTAYDAFWTRDRAPDDADLAAVVYAEFPELQVQGPRTPPDGFLAMCVRAGPSDPSPAFTITSVEGDDVVVDDLTGLVWEAVPDCPAGGLTWAAALARCEGLQLAGSEDWRLPDAQELLSLVEAIRRPVQGHPGFALSCWLWSATSFEPGPDRAFLLHTFDGWLSKEFGKSLASHAPYNHGCLCVRGAR